MFPSLSKYWYDPSSVSCIKTPQNSAMGVRILIAKVSVVVLFVVLLMVRI